MKLTIITICFNIKDDIRATCESIVNQTCQDFEWIVVDGGSTDGTREILEEYKERINVFISEKDEGVYDAMNKGIVRANGEYINFINGGDELHTVDIVETILPLLNSSDVYYGNTVFLNEDGSTQLWRLPRFLPQDFFIKNSISHPSSYIRRELFSQHGLYSTHFKVISDYEFWVILQKNNAKFTHIPHIISIFHCGGISSTSKNIEERIPMMAEYFTTQELQSIFTPKYYEYKFLGFIPLWSIREYPNGTVKYYLFKYIQIMRKIVRDKR